LVEHSLRNKMTDKEDQNDRELLELAAKAYWGDEIDDVCSIEWDSADNCIAYTHADNQDHNGNDVALLWNPLTDDGDALRLAVKLQIHMAKYDNYVSACQLGPAWGGEVVVWDHEEPDPYAATRIAITRVAAAIGKTLI